MFSARGLARILAALAPDRPLLNMCLLLLFSASRFGDLKSPGARVRARRAVVRIELPAAKGATHNDRLVKWFPRCPWRAFGLTPSLRHLPSYGLALARLRVHGATLHSFRRSAVSLLQRRFPLTTVARLTGHKTGERRDEGTIAKYAAPSSKSARAASQTEMSGYLWRVVRRGLPEQPPQGQQKTRKTHTHRTKHH